MHNFFYLQAHFFSQFSFTKQQKKKKTEKNIPDLKVEEMVER